MCNKSFIPATTIIFDVFREKSSNIKGRLQDFQMGGGGGGEEAKNIMRACTVYITSAIFLIRPGSRISDAISYYLSLIFKHFDTRRDTEKTKTQSINFCFVFCCCWLLPAWIRQWYICQNIRLQILYITFNFDFPSSKS